MTAGPWTDPEFEELPPERYELREVPPYSFELGRREFSFLLGAGLWLTIHAGTSIAAGQDRRGRAAAALSQRLHVGSDGTVTVLTGKVEVGQGARTQVAMAAAEELGIPLAQVRVQMADTSVAPDDGGTWGSQTTPATIPAVRRACAALRRLLETSKASSYAELARQDPEALDRAAGEDVSVTPVGDWQVLGTPRTRVNAAAIVTGRHCYPSDVRRPGMLHGVVLRPPSFGATLRSIDLGPAREREGVVAVRDGDFVGFAAPTSAAAREARDRAGKTARWDEAEQPSQDELFPLLRERSRGGRDGNRGSVEEGLAQASEVVEESYHVAYVQHAPMEPRAAVAEWTAEGLTVWTGTQAPSRVLAQLEESFRLARGKVRVVVPDTGGGFGGKHSGEVAVEAARLAKAAGQPVSVCWTRIEEFTWAYFRPAGVIDVRAGVDASGRLTAWEQVNHNSGSSAIETPYDVPNTRSEFRESAAPLRQGSYRALAATANVFARESCMDELAERVGLDPLELRLANLEDSRLRDVLVAAAEAFDWEGRREAYHDSTERGVGLACGTEKGSYTAACVEVHVDWTTGLYRIVEVCEAFECGAIQNPQNLRDQVEGAILQGLGAVLREEIRFEHGRILNPRFSEYRVPRFEDLPRIRTVLLDRPDLPSAGAGETPIVAVAPAAANALFAATGARIRALPIRSDEFHAG